MPSSQAHARPAKTRRCLCWQTQAAAGRITRTGTECVSTVLPLPAECTRFPSRWPVGASRLHRPNRSARRRVARIAPPEGCRRASSRMESHSMCADIAGKCSAQLLPAARHPLHANASNSHACAVAHIHRIADTLAPRKDVLQPPAIPHKLASHIHTPLPALRHFRATAFHPSRLRLKGFHSVARK